MLANGKIRYNINLFVNSYWMPVVLALFIISTHFYSGMPYVYAILCALSSFSLVFNKNPRVLVTSLMLARLCGIGNMKYPASSYIVLGVFGGILLLSIVYYMLCAIKSTKKFKNGSWFWGLVFAFFGVALSGILNETYVSQYLVDKLIIILGIGVGMVLIYTCFANYLETDPNTICNLWDKNPKTVPDYTTSKYFAKQTSGDFLMTTVLLAGVVIAFCVVEFYASCDNIIYALQHKQIRINNMINSYAPYLFFGAVASCYFSAKQKHSLPWIVLCVIFGFLTIFTYSRAVILFTVIFLPIVVLYSLFKSKSPKKYAIQLSIITILSVVVLILLRYFVVDFFQYIKDLGLSGNGREYWWNEAITKFKENPIFGIGLWGDKSDWFIGNFHFWWFHNTVLQIFACFGVFGALFVSLYYIQKYYILVKHRSFRNMYIAFIVLFIAAHGMIDITPFNIDMAVWMFVLIAFAETERASEKSPAGFEIKKKSWKRIVGGNKSMLTNWQKIYHFGIKRTLDILFSGLVLLVFSPLIAVVAIMVRIKLGKPVTFIQIRPGKNLKPFKLYKFRTMKDVRDENGELLPDKERITKFGQLLRKLSLDELPQLWNIFKGDMSLVGPRPRIFKEVIFLAGETLHPRFWVRPGLTGLAQVNGRNDITFDKVVEYDEQYVKTGGFLLDVKIFFKTFIKVFKREGVNKEGTVSNEYYGDYLLRTKRIGIEEYTKKIEQAKKMEGKYDKRENIISSNN